MAGRRGPAPKPTALKLVGGNPGKRPLNLAEPVPPDGEIVKPTLVAEDEIASAEWDRIISPMIACKMVKPLDVGSLIQWCLTWARFEKVARFIRDKGTTYPIYNRHRQVVATKEFPQAAEFRRLQPILIALSRDIGLTPSARSRIASEGAPAKDKSALAQKFFGGA